MVRLFLVSSEVALPFLGGVVGRRTEFVWFAWCEARSCLAFATVQTKGRAYTRPASGTTKRLDKNASARPSWGAHQRCLVREFGRFEADQQPKLRKLNFLGSCYIESI